MTTHRIHHAAIVVKDVEASPQVFTPDGQKWINPGMEFDRRGDYPVVTGYDPGIYEEILRAAVPR